MANLTVNNFNDFNNSVIFANDLRQLKTPTEISESVEQVEQELYPLVSQDLYPSLQNPTSVYDKNNFAENNTLAVLTENSLGTGLTKEIRPLDNPELVRTNGYLQIRDFSGGMQLLQVDINGTGTGGNTTVGFDCINAQYTVKTDAQSIAFEVLDNLQGCFKVDGVFLDKTPFNLSGGGFQQVLLDFPTKQVREITLCSPRNSTVLKKIFVKPTDTIYKPPQGKKVAFIGDSFSVGLKVEKAGQHWPDILSDKFGWDNYLVNGISGTGFIAKTTAQDRYSFVERIPQVAAWQPELLFVNASVNDRGFTENALDTAIDNFLTGVRSSLPNTTIVLIGCIGKNNADSLFVENTAKTVFDRLNLSDCYFIPIQTDIEGAWVTGTGNAGSPSNNGNADIYLDEDGTHFTREGQEYFAKRLVDSVIKTGLSF